MEFYSQCLDSDEGVELTAKDNDDLYQDEISYMEESEATVLEAKILYLLLPKNVPVSRASRLQWLLDHLNSVITIPVLQKWNVSSSSIEAITAVAREQHLTKCNRFLVNYRTEVIFLAHSYRFVYCLDMSPSQCVVDTEKGEILFDEILTAFKTSVEGLTKQFTIPGNSLIFQPSIYLTVMVNTPFFMSPAQQVLVKGVQINLSNVQEIIAYVQSQFHLLEGKIADVTAKVHDQTEIQQLRHEGIVACLFDLPESEKVPTKVPMVSPDANFVNMLRYSMLAVSLLPENSISHILVITDGVVAMPDSNIMESLLFQLHYDSISVSFIKVGSTFHPHSSAGYISYTDLLDFFSHSTMGTCLYSLPEFVHEPSMPMNIYHELFLLWSFHSAIKYDYHKTYDVTKWKCLNDSFYSQKPPTLLSKRQTDENTNASILLLLSRRMREGFAVDGINYINGLVEVQLRLQWKSLIYIIYRVSSQWPVIKNNTHLEVFISAPYEFLHDITCMIRKDSKSLYRQAIIERFWMRLSQLSQADLNLAQQLSLYQNSSVWYTLPESVRSGIPVFTLNSPSETNNILLAPSSTTCPKFMNAWQSISQMEVNNWRKWFHTHKFSLILKHDNPLPKHLHLPNSSQRYQVVQCRQAVTALNGKLAEWASCVLIDNHTYLKFLYKEANKPPSWFCIVRITSKLPCAVLNIGFVTNTPGSVRHETCEFLKRELAALSYMPGPGKVKENACCVLLQKPLEKILIRYERVPSDFSTVIFPDGTQPPHTTLPVSPPLTNSLFTTLSRYLYHKRWIWSASHTSNPRLLDNAMSRILTTLTRMRLKEGFNFAHSSSGIITMVLELWMEPKASCILQYVLFPPHRAQCPDDLYSGSEEENDLETEYGSELQMVTEVWIEPQFGRVQTTNNPRIAYMNNKYYYELADVIGNIDMQCINCLLTMEHLSLMCQEKNRSFSVDTSVTFSRNFSTVRNGRKTSKNNLLDNINLLETDTQWYPIFTQRIEHIPFNFDLINILPLCHQTQLLFSMFIERKDRSLRDYDCDKSNKLLLDNIQEHLISLHDLEISLTKEESDRFTRQIISRHKNTYPSYCPIVETRGEDGFVSQASQWRCFIKGISVTHVIVSFICATLKDLKTVVSNDSTSIPSLSESKESFERSSSRGSNYSDVPINAANSLTLPIYVFDCPLALLVSGYINTPDDSKLNKDTYEDLRFKNSHFSHEDYIRLAREDLSAGISENKNEDSDVPDYTNNVRHHCKTLVLVHLKCFTISLFVALHRDIYVHGLDVQSAMDQCEESLTQIDVTDYILTICGHVKHLTEDKIDLLQLREAAPCNELKSLHSLIKEKFFKMLNVAFIPISTNDEFYFCRYLNSNNMDGKILNNNNISDDEISTPPSERDFSVYSDGLNISHKLDTGEICPLFLHLVCSLRFNGGDVAHTSLKVLPTCLGELTETIAGAEWVDKNKIQVTLDILSLTLPPEVQNVITEYSTQGMRSTSFCSDGFQTSSASTNSEASFVGEFAEPLVHLPENQRKAIVVLRDEVKWLLKDEIATALLDVDTVTLNTLNYVMKHVTDSKGRTSCVMDVIDLNFVFGSSQSHEKFIEEFAKLKVPNYRLIQEEELYYAAKDPNSEFCSKSLNSLDSEEVFEYSNRDNVRNPLEVVELFQRDFDDTTSQPSDMSSVSGSVVGTDCTGYQEDVSNDDDDYEWLQILNLKRLNLPNFWLITQVEQDIVTIYFHCRFLELGTPHVQSYLEVQRVITDEIRELCKKVNQSLLLQSLYETRICDLLLEPDDNAAKEWPGNIGSLPMSRDSSYLRLRSMEETNDENELMSSSVTLSEVSLSFKAGYFKCPVVWQTHFILHPRLKTGPRKSGLSRGILALKNILDKFSVSNRNNMFVYRDNRNNVFYLRLHENVQSSSTSKSATRSNEYESTLVSRSPSIASLPLNQSKSNLSHYEHSLSSLLSDDIRPRVRSFGEKESKDGPNEDTLILKVHGITEAGNDVQCELVQVLQNRLDDAVLEFLSVMLARNAMCPLTPEDVQFIQKPFRPPEIVIKLTMQDFVLLWIDSFTHYLKQNLLQFLNVPKYIDNRTHSHFKDYTEPDQVMNRITDDGIFLYNQSQNPSSGSRGIACVALAVVGNMDNKPKDVNIKSLEKMFQTKAFKTIVESEILTGESELPPVYLEFRLWKQGRVNIDNLSVKLRDAISQATWDIVMEYLILTAPLCEEASINPNPVLTPINITTAPLNFSKEIEFICNIDEGNRDNIKIVCKRKLKALFPPRKRLRRINPPTTKTSRSITFDDYDRDKEAYFPKIHNLKPVTKLSSFEIGDEGVLTVNYSKYLPEWLDFGSDIIAPSVRKHKMFLTNPHLLNTTIKELLNIVQDTPKAFRAVSSHVLAEEDNESFVPFEPKKLVDKCVIISRNFDNWKASTTLRGTLDCPESMSPHALKHTQKFVPIAVNNKFIPRQKILWVLVESDSIFLYTYNWARDNVDKLVTNCTKLSQWLSMRSCFLNSVTAQKLGLFHNQAIIQKQFSTSTNPYTYVIGSKSSMVDFPRDDNRKTLANTSNFQVLLEAFRDSFYTLKYNGNDAVAVFAMEMQEMKIAERKSRDELKKLHSMYQSRTSTTTVPQIFLLMQNSRIIHYCHTPLLFLPEWRLKSAATRDHSLCSPTHRTQRNLEKDSWHTELCYGFLCEYRRYLQTLGFMPLQIDNSDKKLGIWARDNSSYNFIFYIQKTIMGGILIFTVEFNEPFFTTTLHAIEGNRLQNITSRASINRFTLCFLDECDRVKILMHLHSFTYDYHLRCVYNYISSNPSVNRVCDKYNVTKFFDDFLKYYNKGPNFARNLVHADTITIKNLLTEGKQLYDYLLTNVEQYDFKLLDMDRGDGEIEYILVQVTSNPQVSYKDSQDRQHTDDFEITLVVYNLCTPYTPTDHILHLKYYLILSSKREIYPKAEVEHKLGKFRTVSSTTRGLAGLEKIHMESSLTKSEHSGQFDLENSGDELYITSDDQSEEKTDDEATPQTVSISQVEISPESVNYLGYYSSHEQLMQQMILDKALTTQTHIKDMVAKGVIHCRTHLLWNKLASPQDSNTLTYEEFMELKGLSKLEHLCDVHPNLLPLLSNQPLSWYQGLGKLLLTKYSDNHRSFLSGDGNIQHYVILDQRYFGAFMLLSTDLHTSRGDLYAVYRQPPKEENEELCVAYRKTLLDGFVNCICFYLWYGMI